MTEQPPRHLKVVPQLNVERLQTAGLAPNENNVRLGDVEILSQHLDYGSVGLAVRRRRCDINPPDAAVFEYAILGRPRDDLGFNKHAIII